MGSRRESLPARKVGRISNRRRGRRLRPSTEIPVTPAEMPQYNKCTLRKALTTHEQSHALVPEDLGKLWKRMETRGATGSLARRGSARSGKKRSAGKRRQTRGEDLYAGKMASM
jgi:hypothetical protein